MVHACGYKKHVIDEQYAAFVRVVRLCRSTSEPALGLRSHLCTAMTTRNITITLEVPDLGFGDGHLAAWVLLVAWTLLIGAAVHWCVKGTRSAQPAVATPSGEIAAKALRPKVVETSPGAADTNPALWANQQGEYYHFSNDCSHMLKYAKKTPRELWCCPECQKLKSLVIASK